MLHVHRRCTRLALFSPPLSPSLSRFHHPSPIIASYNHTTKIHVTELTKSNPKTRKCKTRKPTNKKINHLLYSMVHSTYPLYNQQQHTPILVFSFTLSYFLSFFLTFFLSSSFYVLFFEPPSHGVRTLPIIPLVHKPPLPRKQLPYQLNYIIFVLLCISFLSLNAHAIATSLGFLLDLFLLSFPPALDSLPSSSSYILKQARFLVFFLLFCCLSFVI